jgi:hypothetical protein
MIGYDQWDVEHSRRASWKSSRGPPRARHIRDGDDPGISYASIHTRITNLRLKMNAASIAHAVARGYEIGILELRTAEPRVMMAVTLSPAPIH